MNQKFSEDLEHLKILSIFYYIAAGLCLFPMLYGMFYLVFGVFFGAMIMSVDAPHRPGEPNPEVIGGIFGGIFVFVGLLLIVIPLTLGILLFKVGRNLTNLQSYTFCLVIAGISCLVVPIGTILGVFSIIVLTRDSVKALFNGQNFNQYGNTPPNWQ